MTNSSSYKQLEQNLAYLNLKQMQIHLDDVINFSVNNNLSLTEALVKLTSYEIDFKEKNMIRSMVKVAAFPHLKELKDFDFDFQPSINKNEIIELASLRFIEKAENIVFLGSSGVGNYEK